MNEIDPTSEIYAEKVCNALEWFKHARSLLAAARSTTERANLLIDYWERSDLLNVASMLYGFSLENLFKAKWILMKFGPPDHEDWVPVSEFPKEIKSHDLVHLATQVDAQLADEYRTVLSILSDCTTWSGRYPCSLKAHDSASFRWPALNEDADKIFIRFSKEFTALA